jgi:hypothetical protein
MTTAAITKQGLAAMAVLVAILWGCLVAERLMVDRAGREMSRALRDIQTLQIKMQQPSPADPARTVLRARPAHS